MLQAAKSIIEMCQFEVKYMGVKRMQFFNSCITRTRFGVTQTQVQYGPFYQKSTTGKTKAAIEANNDMYCLRK